MPLDPPNLEDALGVDARGEGAQELRGRRLEVPMALGLRELTLVLVDLARPEAVNLGAFLGSEHGDRVGLRASSGKV